MINPNTPGCEIIFETTTNISSGFVFGVITEGLTLEIALPIHPAFPTTIAESGTRKRILKIAALRPSSTLLHAMNRITSPIFMNKNPTDPATVSCQKIPTKLNPGGSLK